MDAIWGLLAFVVIGLVISVIFSRIRSGYRMKSLHRQPATTAPPYSDLLRPWSAPTAAVPPVAVPPVTIAPLTETYPLGLFIANSITPSRPAPASPASPRTAPPSPLRPGPVPSGFPPAAPVAPAIPVIPIIPIASIAPVTPATRTFRITSGPTPSASAPVNLSVPPARPFTVKRPRMSTKGRVSAPGRCMKCHTKGRVMSAGPGKWRCVECEYEW